MSTSRMQKNKNIHDKLKQEEKEQHTTISQEYENILEDLDPSLTKGNKIGEDLPDFGIEDEEKLDKLFDKEYDKNYSKDMDDFLNEFADEEDEFDFDSKEEEKKPEEKENTTQKFDIQPVEKPTLEYNYSKEIFENNKEISEQLVTFTDKISVEELLRKRIEEQEKLLESKKRAKKTPTNKDYTSKQMQERVNVLEGVDIRKEISSKKIVKKTKNLLNIIIISALTLLIIVGFVVIAILIL